MKSIARENQQKTNKSGINFTELARRKFMKQISTTLIGIILGLKIFGYNFKKTITTETNDTHEILYKPSEHDLTSLPSEKREAIEKRRVMYIVIVTTEEAQAEVESIGGDFKAGTEKIAQSTQAFFANAGADIEFSVQCDDVDIDVIVIPRSEYADEEGQTSETAEDYMNTNLTSGSYLDTKFQELASAKGIPRDKLCPFMYITNHSGGALTNYNKPGIVIDAESALHPTYYQTWQEEVGPHEFVKKLIREHPDTKPDSFRHAFRWEVPTDNEGNLLYDFREKSDDPLPVTAIHSAGFPSKGTERLIPNIPDKDMQISLYDRNSGEYITIDFGSETADPWHYGYWETLDNYTHEREADTTAPELLPEDGLFPVGTDLEDDTTFDLKMNFNEDVVAGAGKIRLYGTYIGEGDSWGNQEYLEFDASDLIISGSSVSLPVSLNKFTEYYVNVDEGVILDTSGNSFAGINDNSTWVFETKNFATDAEDIKQVEFKVYPNNFPGTVNISNAEKLSKIELTTLHGQLLETFPNPSFQIYLNGNGIANEWYLLKLYDKNGKFIYSATKIVKLH